LSIDLFAYVLFKKIVFLCMMLF